MNVNSQVILFHALTVNIDKIIIYECQISIIILAVIIITDQRNLIVTFSLNH